MASITPEQMAAARERVDAASAEAVSLALDAIYDTALQKALMERSAGNSWINDRP